VTDGALPLDMKPELEAPIASEEFKPAKEKKKALSNDGQKKTAYSEFYTNVSDIIKKTYCLYITKG
jgi:cell fate (sporulation/competence/biofilm development) regulator YlbF (YheA/YmcA/DUF963 family)